MGWRRGALLGIAVAVVGCDPDGPRTISGRAYTTWSGEQGTAEVPVDLAGDRLLVMIPDGADGFISSTTARIHEDGSFEIPGVDRGPYYLIWQDLDEEDSPVFIWVEDADTVAHPVYLRAGRPDPTPAGTGTVEIRIENLRPWSWQQHSIALHTPNLRASRSWEIAGELGDGDTEALIGPADISSLIEGSRGDRVYVDQSRIHQVGNAIHRSIRRFGTIPEFDMVADATTEVAVTLEEPERDRSLELAIGLPGQAEHAAGFEPTASLVRVCVYGTAMPRWWPVSLVGQAPQVNGWCVDDVSAPVVDTLHYADPFPDSWQRYAMVRTYVELDLANGFPGVWFVAAEWTSALEDFDSSASVRVTAPRDVLIDGIGAWAQGRTHRTVPVISWTPPRIGADGVRYEVTILGPASVSRVAARFSTDATRVTIPPGLLKEDRIYQVRIMAIAGGDNEHGWAATLSSEFWTESP